MKTTIVAAILSYLLTPVLSHADLAFVANIDDNWELFSVSEDGADMVRLSKTPYDEKDPAWSKDGREIAYLTSDGQVRIIRLSSLKTKSISSASDNASKYSPVFTPDNSSIAYAQTTAGPGDDSNLHIFDFNTSEETVILDQQSIQMWPSYSPNGNKLVYTSLHCNESCGRFIQELWILSTITQQSQQLLLTNSFCKQPVYSPDGNSIAFASDMSGNFDIWLISLKNWSLSQITHDLAMDESPTWSPDGSRVAFISNRSGTSEIWVKDIESKQISKIKPFGDNNVACRDVAWRPE